MRILLILFFVFCFSPAMICAQQFTGSFDLIVGQANQSENVDQNSVSYFIGKDKSAIIVRPGQNQPDMKMIFDFSKKTITNLFEINGKKGGYILPMNEEYWPGITTALYESLREVDPEYTFTGKTKEIEGHLCKEVTAESDDYEATLWIAEDIPYSIANVLSYQSVGKGKSRDEIEMFNKFGINSLPLETFLISKTGKEDILIQIANLSDDFDIDVFDTEGHTLSEME